MTCIHLPILLRHLQLDLICSICVNVYASEQIQIHWGLTVIRGVCCKLIPHFF